ncbi:MAG: hypothetical protein AAGB31_13405 [Bdellovibrio sp.]
MITAQTLVGLACLLSNGGTADQAQLQQLTETQTQHIEALMSEEPCLPENFEALVKQTEEKLNSDTGDIPDILAMPTVDCIKGF